MIYAVLIFCLLAWVFVILALCRIYGALVDMVTLLNKFFEDVPSLRSQLATIIQKEDELMAGQEVIEAALVKIDTATTQQGVILQAQGVTLQTISDEIDALIIAAQNGTITPAQLARLQTLADNAATVSANIAAQAEFSKAIAAKGASTPVPGPVPVPTPIP